jgi:hypothetical protein
MMKYGPNVDQAARDALEDLGLVDDDRTEDLRAVASSTRGASA